LTGDLGTGKTLLTQGIAVGFGIQHQIISPTFTLINSYDSEKGALYHLDLYRLADPLEIFELGLESYLEDLHAMIVIEWGERILHALSEPLIQIKLEYRQKGREATILLHRQHTEIGKQIDTYFADRQKTWT
jgi:tRNA threonylcarbamoyladenosine biosynthesis protein TsaE